MHDPEPPFRPIRTVDGYLPLEDYGLIGDGTTAALVGVDGSIPWMCLPRFDAEPLFCGLLDHARGGHFTVAPRDLAEGRQRYQPDTGVLETELRCRTGVVRVTDAMVLRPGADLGDDAPANRAELVRCVTVVAGHAHIAVDLAPRGGARIRPVLSGLEIRAASHPDMQLHLRANQPLDGLHTTVDMEQGQQLELVLSWGRFHRHHRFDATSMLRHTADAWQSWMADCCYDGPEQPLVRRAAITLKLCDHWVNGSLVAAPTSSLPAPIGGIRNWDYRYVWVRDAAYTVFALRRIGFHGESDAFLGWVLDAFERSTEPRIMYTLGGDPVADETHDTELEGYRRSGPVRWGNGAADQRQHDVYGEILDCADQWLRSSGDIAEISPVLWANLTGLAEAAGRSWQEPDQGIWEVRNRGRVFTYSAAMCEVAVDRAASIAQRYTLDGPVAQWRATAAQIRESILKRSWDDKAHTLSAHLDGGGVLDAGLLALPLRQVIPADHPRMIATTTAVADRLNAGNGLLYRYLHDDSPDGLPGEEGAFVLCSFWMVDNLTLQGRLDEAEALYESLCARAGTLGLFAEQIDPTTGAFMGNFPQAFSHIGVIAAGVNLARAKANTP